MLQENVLEASSIWNLCGSSYLASSG